MTKYEKFEKSLMDMDPMDRLCALHYTLRNIPRVFLEEYLSVTEERVEEVFNTNHKEKS